MQSQNDFQIDLLAAARCNLFSHSLAAYQTNCMAINEKNQEVLEAHIKIIESEPRKHNFGILKELGQEVAAEKPAGGQAKLEVNDKDQRLFFGDEFSDSGPSETKAEEENVLEEKSNSEKLIDYDHEKDFEEFMGSAGLLPSQLLLDDSLFNTSSMEASNVDLLGSLQADTPQENLLGSSREQNSIQLNKNPSKKANDISKWFSLFSDLDPLNQQTEQDDASKNLHAA